MPRIAHALAMLALAATPALAHGGSHGGFQGGPGGGPAGGAGPGTFTLVPNNPPSGGAGAGAGKVTIVTNTPYTRDEHRDRDRDRNRELGETRRIRAEIAELGTRALLLTERVQFLKTVNGDPREIARLTEEITHLGNRIERLQREEGPPA